MLELLKLMLREEYRFHTAYTNRLVFFFFPMFVLVSAFVVGISLREMTAEYTTRELLMSLHAMLMVYGISSGALAFLGREVAEQKFGTVSFLTQSTTALPLSFKKVFMTLYVREIVFYILLSIVPLTLGLLISVPFSGLAPLSIIALFGTMLIAFMLGISFSFFMASVYMRSFRAFVVLCVSVLALAAGTLAFTRDIALFIPALGLHTAPYFAAIITLIISFSIASLLLAKRESRARAEHHTSIYPRTVARFEFTSYAPFLAKEFIDLKRSNTLSKMFFSFLFPLIFITGLSWFIERKVALGFNTISYAVFIGFFSLVIYSWLNNIDSPEFLDALPVKLPQLIRTRALTHMMITATLSPAFVVAVGLLNREPHLIPAALGVMFVVALYSVLAIAYLTGVRMNTYLFDIKVFAQFGIISLLPMCIITMLSLKLGIYSYLLMLFVFSSLLLVSRMFYNHINIRWADENFKV